MSDTKGKQEGYYVQGGVFSSGDYKKLKEGYEMWDVGPFRTKEAAELVCKALSLDWAQEENARFYISHSEPSSYWVVGGRYTDTQFQKLVTGEEERYGPFDSYEEAHDVWLAKSMEQIDDCMVRFRLDKLLD